MEATVAAFRERLTQPWLDEPTQEQVRISYEKRLAELTERQRKKPAVSVLLAEEKPAALLGGLLAAVAARAPLFLASPGWRENEWTQVAVQMEPGLIWGTAHLPLHVPMDLPALEPFVGHIMIPTGGTGGRVRFTMHTWETLGAAVQGYAEFYHTAVVNAWCVLPLWHVSGLMQALRSFITGGRLVLGNYHQFAEPEAGLPGRDEFHLSLVPTQFGRILAQSGGADWLGGFGLLLLGGAGVAPDLRERARAAELGLSCSYGMTETAAVIAAQRPEDFLAGEPLAGELFPHVRVMMEAGGIVIRSGSLFHGYYPERPYPQAEFRPGDEGEVDSKGRLRILGRRDRLIVSGGEKVDPQEVEAAIRRLAPEAEALVVGEPDPDWGQRVVALVAGLPASELKAHQQALRGQVQPAFMPKRWLLVETLPLKTNGKLDLDKLAQLLAAVGT